MSGGREHKISIRELVEFVERSGDINYRFSSRSSALEGIKGHQRLQRARAAACGDQYQAEKQVSARVSVDGLDIVLAGRVDGYFPQRRPLEVEEIKTMRASPQDLPAGVRHVHWAQAKVYAALLAAEHDVQAVVVRLCYLNLDDDSEYNLEQLYTRQELDVYFESVTGRYADWLQGLHRWHGRRNDSIGTLSFPYGQYRSGQRDMAVSVYRALKEESHLVMEAPTGIGKTMAALFPAVKALRELDYDKAFFLTAKTSGQETAQRAVADLKRQGLQLRDITLTAKDKVCFNPGSPCDAEHCEFAAGYYDRLPVVIENVMNSDRSLDRGAIEALARENTLCPFELSLDLSRLCDVVICDYNYVFDPTVYLRRYFDGSAGRYAFLVDESHNLVDRGRAMFSAEINKDAYLSLRKELDGALPSLAKSLARVNAAILALRRPSKSQFERIGYLRFADLPDKVLAALRGFCEKAEDWLRENSPASYQPALLALYFDSLRFIRTAEWFDSSYVCLMERTGGGVLLRLYNLNPATGLGEGMRRGTAGLCFSATMTPQPYFEQLMGLGEESTWYRIASPFNPANLGVFSIPFISTAYRDRDASLGELAQVVADIVAVRRGNYLVYLPSHTYLDKLYDHFTRSRPEIGCIRQRVGMDEREREAFLSSFVEDQGQETLVGFAVMGGVFAEAVDLKGTRLIGVVVVGVGLPGIGVERNLIRDYFAETDDAGFEFAYQYPGMNRVLQTAGRVIRSESDKGIVCLVDRRFAEPRYRRLLPGEWCLRECRSRPLLAGALTDFWRGHDPD